LFEWTLEFR